MAVVTQFTIRRGLYEQAPLPQQGQGVSLCRGRRIQGKGHALNVSDIDIVVTALLAPHPRSSVLCRHTRSRSNLSKPAHSLPAYRFFLNSFLKKRRFGETKQPDRRRKKTRITTYPGRHAAY